MTHSEVVNSLISIVQQIQSAGDKSCPSLTGSSSPLTQCPGFDSLNAVEATAEIIHILKVDLPFNNVFFDDPNILNIDQAATRILGFIK